MTTTTGNEHEYGDPGDRMSWAADAEARSLRDELTHLERLARKARGSADPLRRQIAASLHPPEEHVLPDLQEMRDAWDAFQAAPPDVRNTILGGWPTPERFATPDDLRDGVDPQPRVGRFASVRAEAGDPDSATVGGIEVWSDRGAADVVALIREGVSRADAVAALGTLAEAVASEWDRLIGG